MGGKGGANVPHPGQAGTHVGGEGCAGRGGGGCQFGGFICQKTKGDLWHDERGSKGRTPQKWPGPRFREENKNGPTIGKWYGGERGFRTKREGPAKREGSSRGTREKEKSKRRTKKTTRKFPRGTNPSIKPIKGKSRPSRGAPQTQVNKKKNKGMVLGTR